MNIIFLSSETVHHYYLINEIHKICPVKKVFFQISQLHRRSLPEKIQKWIHPRNYGTAWKVLLERVLLGREKVLEDQFDQKYLFNGQTPQLDSDIPTEKVYTFNDKSAVESVRASDPDLIIVFGTEILKGEILRAARSLIVNIHRGILPKYRGGGITDWMFYHNDFENVGTTVHICSEKLDAGDVLGQKFYRLQPDDRIYQLRGKTTVLAFEILKEIIDKMNNGTLERQHQTILKPWSSKELTLSKKLIARRNFNRHIHTLKKG